MALTCLKCGFGNPDGARFCSSCGSPLETARPIDGERKFATILFADVARSTTIAEQLDPEDWALIMNGAFGFMNNAVSRYGGTVSRLMGDAVLALFGAPVAHEDDAERAVRAGLEIQEAAAAYAQSVKQRYRIDFGLRVGINTGTAVLAFVGDAIKTEYTAMGDAANTAARLQSAAAPGTVLISADTYRLVHNLFDVRPRGAIEMRGRSAPVEAYEIAGLKAAPESARGLAGLESPIVGRDAQLQLLRSRFESLLKGRGSAVAIVGEAGIGKSRLVAELRRLNEARPEANVGWRETRGISYGTTVPYYPWRLLGRQLVGASESDSPQEVRNKIAGWVEQHALQTRDIPLYETMLAVDGDQSRETLAGMSGEAVVSGVGSAVVAAVKASIGRGTDKQPHVVVLDDLHWSDTASLELAAQVATLTNFEPLMLVCVLRPDRRAPSWHLLDRLQASLGDCFVKIELEPLDAAASSQLLANLLHIEGLPESIRAQILQRSEGNPFYLEEVLRSLIDSGQVVHEGEHWRATRDIVDASIPETLAGVLSARIDRLPDTTKRVAQTAAVIGRVFQHRLLEEVCHTGAVHERIEHVEPHLATLSYEQLVREKARDPEREYIFKHALTCEAAYELLLKSRRRDLHARTAAAMEAMLGDRRDEFAAMMAHHFLEADNPAKAFEYSRIAAENAARLFAPREEIGHLEVMVKLTDRLLELPPATIIDTVHRWVIVRHRLNNYEGVVERLEAAASMAREAHDDWRLGRTLSWIANVHMVTGYPSRSIPYLKESQEIGRKVGDETMLLLPLFAGTWQLVDRDPAAGERALAEVVDIARRNDVIDVLGHAIAYRAIALARLGRFEEARTCIAEALQVADMTEAPVKRADVHIAASMALYDMGEIEEGLRHARIGADLAYGARGMECACAGFYCVGRGHLEERRIEDALTVLGRSLHIAEEIGFEGYINVIRGSIASAEIEEGQQAAIEKLKTAEKNAKAVGDQYAAAVLNLPLARYLTRQGQAAEAEAGLAEATAYFRAKAMTPYIANALEATAEIRESQGRAAEAADARAEAAGLRAEVAMSHPGAADAMQAAN